MAAKTRKLNVRYSPEAWATIGQIWDWNADHYNPDHADRYTAFLLARIDHVAAGHLRGRIVPNQPQRHYVAVMRKPKKHGHVVVYELLPNEILVIDVFHTAQDWQTKLRDRE